MTQTDLTDDDPALPSWQALATRGALAAAFGFLTLLVPGLSLFALVMMFGAFALADGVANLVGFLRAARQREPWGALLLEALVSIAAGVLTLLAPGITAVALAFTIGVWAVIRGALTIATAIQLRKQIKGEWLLVLSGLLSIALGTALLFAPGPGALAVVVWIGAYALVSGVLLIALALRVRSAQQGPHAGPPRPAHGL